MPKKEKYLILKKPLNLKNFYNVWNKNSEMLGRITKKRVGAFIHWGFVTKKGFHITGGCMDEIRAMIKNPQKYLEEQNNG